MTLDDLRDQLASVGVPVLQPGEAFAALPCLQLVPVRWEMAPGNRYAQHVVDVVVCTHLTPYGPKYAELADLTTATLRALTGTQFALDPQIPHASDPDSEPAYQSMTVNVAYQGTDVC